MSIIERAIEQFRGNALPLLDPAAAPRRLPFPHEAEPSIVTAFGTAAAQPIVRNTPAPGTAAAYAPPVPRQPPLHITREALTRGNFVTPGGGRTPVAEDFRRVKRELLMPPLTARRILVTSPLPGEGKTFCAINLALGIAMELHRSVLLIDADTIRPSVLGQLGLPPGLPGLLDVLANHETALDAVIRDTSVDNLALLPAGTAQPNATELLASDGMRDLLERLGRSDDRIVIVDSAPLLLASETAALAAHMTQIVVVAAAQQTTESALREALKRLDGCECPVSAVLNKGNRIEKSGYYGYGGRYDGQ